MRFLGPNGAGKPTTSSMLLHLLRPTSGRALLFGRDVWHDSGCRPGARRCHDQSARFLPVFLSGRTNLRVFARLRGLPDRRVDAVLDLVGLVGCGQDKVKRYS